MEPSSEFIKKQKNILTNEKEKLEKKIKELNRYPDLGSSTDDNVSETAEYESNMPLENEAKLILKRVDAALLSIVNGTYGKCSKCSKAIEEGHLQIVPYADICSKCSSKKMR